LKIKPLLLSLALIPSGFGARGSLPSPHQVLNLEKGLALSEGQKEDRCLGEDKLKHLMVSTFLTGIGYRLSYDGFDWPQDRSRVVASSITLSIGLGKELKDQVQKGDTFSFKDLVADLLGIGMGLLILTTW
jgi:uncharacterized protein YfiM (DUF2279 family)